MFVSTFAMSSKFISSYNIFSALSLAKSALSLALALLFTTMIRIKNRTRMMMSKTKQDEIPAEYTTTSDVDA